MPVDLTAFPAPRFDRAAAGGPALGLLAPPRGRIFPFRISLPITSRTTISSPRILGPALLRSMKLLFGTSSSPNAGVSFELGVAQASVAESGVGLTVVKPYRLLLEKLDESPANDAASMTGFGNAQSQATSEFKDATLGVPILDPSFFLTFSGINSSGIASDVYGHVVLLEAVDPQVLANFL